MHIIKESMNPLGSPISFDFVTCLICMCVYVCMWCLWYVCGVCMVCVCVSSMSTTVQPITVVKYRVVSMDMTVILPNAHLHPILEIWSPMKEQEKNPLH